MAAPTDRPPAVAITSERNVTVSELVNEADLIWRALKTKKYSDADAHEVMESVRAKHPQFCTSYPLVLRYMVQMREYSSVALRRYLMHLATKPWKSEAEYTESQADYVVRLYKETHPRWDKNHVNNLRSNICTMLRQETETFKQNIENFNRVVDAREQHWQTSVRADFKAFVTDCAPDALANVETVRVESDLPACVNVLPQPCACDLPVQITADELLL